VCSVAAGCGSGASGGVNLRTHAHTAAQQRPQAGGGPGPRQEPEPGRARTSWAPFVCRGGVIMIADHISEDHHPPKTSLELPKFSLPSDTHHPLLKTAGIRGFWPRYARLETPHPHPPHLTTLLRILWSAIIITPPRQTNRALPRPNYNLPKVGQKCERGLLCNLLENPCRPPKSYWGFLPAGGGERDSGGT
jgi:hypothetical protein